MHKTIVLDIETYPDTAAAARAGADLNAGFPLWPLHQLACVSLFIMGRDAARKPVFSIETFSRADMSERGIIASVEREIENAFEVITFNGRGFDLPVLMLRAALTGERAPTIARLYGQSRHAVGCHVDLLKEVTNFGAAPKMKLGGLCAAFDIPVKVEAHGSDVTSLVERDEWGVITRYCETDVLATAISLQSWRSAQRADPDLLMESRPALAAWIIGNQPHRAHLLPYAKLKTGPDGGPAMSTAHFARIRF